MRRISYRRGVRFFGVDAVFLDRVGYGPGLDLALVRQRLERGDGDEVAVHLKELPQLRARIGTPETIGAEHAVRAALRDERADLLGKGLHVIARCEHRTRGP